MPACDYPDDSADIPAENPDFLGRTSFFHVSSDELVAALRDEFEMAWDSGLKILLGSGRGPIEFVAQRLGNLDADEQLLSHLHDCVSVIATLLGNTLRPELSVSAAG